MEYPSFIGERIKTVRKKLSLSQEEFGNALGCGRGAIFNIERGIVEPKDLFLQLICKTYNVNEQWLKTGIGDIFVSRDIDEELADEIGMLVADEDGKFKKRFIAALLRLDESAWKNIEKFARDILENDISENDKEN